MGRDKRVPPHSVVGRLGETASLLRLLTSPEGLRPSSLRLLCAELDRQWTLRNGRSVSGPHPPDRAGRLPLMCRQSSASWRRPLLRVGSPVLAPSLLPPSCLTIGPDPCAVPPTIPGLVSG